jgi:hypothetical protein
MDPRVRQRALEAAAKVALSVTSLGGCGGMALTPNEGGSPESWTAPPAEAGAFFPEAGALSHEAGALEESGRDAFAEPIEAGLCGSFPGGAPSSEATVRCCRDYIRSSSEAGVESWNQIAAEPGVADCCHSILSYCEVPTAPPICAFYDVVSFVCCPILPTNRASFCGPWGPPTPPAMPSTEWLA